jgi:putative nucleotidyltransferase with HDIG domain
MKRFLPARSRLYSQIVLPLLIASVTIGAVAMLASAYFLDGLATKWASGVAESATGTIIRQMEDHAAQLVRAARVAANDMELRRVLSDEDMPLVHAGLVAKNTSLDLDHMMLLDRAGRVVAVTGAGVQLGDRPFGDLGTWKAGSPRTAYARVDGQLTLSALSPLSLPPGDYTLAVSRVVNDDFIKALGVGENDAFAFYDSSGRLAGLSVGRGLDRAGATRIADALRAPVPLVRTLLDDASSGGPSLAQLESGELQYQLYARRITLQAGEGSDATGYFVGAINKGVSVQEGVTARNLVGLWSIVAVVALVALGGWVAHRVSDPLVVLADGARRIADGDFSTKVRVSTSSEIGDLASTFNEMTDSLRERSESLTKKVLELATLYEMSRSLSSTLDMEELLGSVLDSALRIFDLDLGYVALRDRETDTLVVRALRGSRGSATDGAVRSSMSEWVVREGRPLIFNPDVGSAYEQIDTVTGAKAALCVPLMSSEGTIGSVTVGSSDIDYRFNSDDVRLLSTIANHVTIAIGNIELFSSLQDAYLATVRSLAAAVDAKDSYTRGHSDFVATYATAIAEKMGLSQDQRIALEMAAYLHDIGKIGVSEEILLKPGKLDDDEMTQMRHHPLIGANILKPVAFPWAITPVVRHHHEAWDGSGYPAGLRGEEIPLLARVLAVADSYEAITADRPYRAGRTAREALAELDDCAGTQFDPRIVAVFTEITLEEIERESSIQESASEEVTPEEVRAIFSVLVDGVLSSFRRLGGPRLALNVEQELDQFLVGESLPFRIAHGRITFTEGVTPDTSTELGQMKTALDRTGSIIGRLSGGTLVEHFFSDALGELSVRMQTLACELELYRD